jgi:hypothetical protein
MACSRVNFKNTGNGRTIENMNGRPKYDPLTSKAQKIAGVTVSLGEHQSYLKLLRHISVKLLGQKSVISKC